MRRTLKSMALVLIILSQVACSKNEEDPSEKMMKQAMINQCIFDATGNCPRQALALLSGGPAGLMALQAQMAATKSTVPGLQPPNSAAGINPFAVADNNVTSQVPGLALRARANRIAGEIKAIESNPNSSYYTPPQAGQAMDPVAAAVATRAPASRSASPHESEAAQGSSSGTGEITH